MYRRTTYLEAVLRHPFGKMICFAVGAVIGLSMGCMYVIHEIQGTVTPQHYMSSNK